MEPADIELDHREKYNKAIGNALDNGYFEGWFHIQKNDKTSAVSGAWDFRIHMLTDVVCEHIQKTEKALEIGHGGGRLIRHAARHFDFVYGVDIHKFNDEVRKRVQCQNIELDTPIEKIENIDFVYSFITFLHLQSIDEFYRYMKEIKRLLNVGGIAQIYYQRFVDNGLENGYRVNTDACANSLSLQIGKDIIQEVCDGFDVIDTGKSWKGIAGYKSKPGHQNYITLKKR